MKEPGHFFKSGIMSKFLESQVSNHALHAEVVNTCSVNIKYFLKNKRVNTWVDSFQKNNDIHIECA